MPTCFVIMPITTPAHHVDRYGGDEDHFVHVLEHLFAPALEAAGYEAISPVASGSDLIQAEIIRNLDEADLALCDMTTLNANVFFELGIRTALNKPVATVRDAFTKRIPFDHSMVNCFEYRWQMETWVVKEEIPRLAAHIRACVERGGETNTLWKRLGIEAEASVGSAGTTDDDKFDYIVRQLEDLRSEVRRSRKVSGAPRTLSLVIEPNLSQDLRRLIVGLHALQLSTPFVLFEADGDAVIDLGRAPITLDEIGLMRVLADVVGFRLFFISSEPTLRRHLSEQGLGAPDGLVLRKIAANAAD